MPNYCWNGLYISADPKNKESLKQLKDFYKKSIIKIEDDYTFTFDGILPTPKDLLDISCPTKEMDNEKAESNIEKYGFADWYEWRLSKWGTKWDAYDVYINKKMRDYISLSFDTAWCPPIKYYDALANKYPLLTIEAEYSEPGCDFAGKRTYIDGAVSEDVCMSYNKWRYIDDYDSWWDEFAIYVEDGHIETLKDFKEDYKDVWEIMPKKHRKEVREILKTFENQNT